VEGRRGSPHEKLSSSATRSGSAPTATTLRIASSITAKAIASGSWSPYHGLTPIPIAMPSVEPGVGEHDTVGGAVGRCSDERPDHGGAEDLVVVTVDRVGLGRDVRMGEEGEDRGGRIGDAPAGAVVAVRIREFGRHAALWSAVVEEGGVEIDDDVALMAHDQSPVAGERAHVRETYPDAVASCLHGGEMLRWHGDHHALLGLGQPHFPGVETGVLAGNQIEVDVGADALGHLADR
jgi:hypothetical protein